MTLDMLHPGESGVIKNVGGRGALRNRLLDMGLIPGTAVSVSKAAPLGDPIELQVRGYVLTMRLEDAALITLDEDSLNIKQTNSGRKAEC